MLRIAPIAIAVFAIQAVSITPTHSQEPEGENAQAKSLLSQVDNPDDFIDVIDRIKKVGETVIHASATARRAGRLSNDADKAKAQAETSNNQIPAGASNKPTALAQVAVAQDAATNAKNEADTATKKLNETLGAAKRASTAATNDDFEKELEAANKSLAATRAALVKTEAHLATARNAADNLARIASQVTSGSQVSLEDEINELVREFRAEDKAKMLDVARPIRRTIQQKRVADVEYANWVEINGKFYRETKKLSIPYYVDARTVDLASGNHYVGERNRPKYQLVPAADVSAVGGAKSGFEDLKDFDGTSPWSSDSSNSDTEANYLILEVGNNLHLAGIVYLANQDADSQDERPTRVICRVHHGDIKKVEDGSPVAIQAADLKAPEEFDLFGPPVVLKVSKTALEPQIVPFPVAIRQAGAPSYVLLEFPEPKKDQKKISIAELHFFKLNGEDRDVIEESRR